MINKISTVDLMTRLSVQIKIFRLFLLRNQEIIYTFIDLLVSPRCEIPFQYFYLRNWCKASSNSFFVPSSDQLTGKAASTNFRIHFLNLDRKCKKLDNITLMQTFNIACLSNEELYKLPNNFLEIKQAYFEYVNPILKGNV